MNIPAQLWIDFGAEAARLYNRFYPLLLRQAWDDAAAQLGIELAFDLDNPFVQEVLTELGQQIRGIVDTTRDEIQVLVGRQADEGWSVQRLADEIAKLAETSAPRRALLIARTETASAYSRGSLLAYQESGVVEGVEWLTTDPCPTCEPLSGKIVPLGEAFADGIEYPPAHPACRCAIAPVVSV